MDPSLRWGDIRRSKERPPRANGFTLVEVLVALVVTSLLLVVVMDGALTARERDRRAAAERDAVVVARVLLAEATVAPFFEGSRTGTDGALSWDVRESVAMADPRGRFVLSEIQVAVKDGNGRQVYDVVTRRLKPAVLQ